MVLLRVHPSKYFNVKLLSDEGDYSIPTWETYFLTIFQQSWGVWLFVWNLNDACLSNESLFVVGSFEWISQTVFQMVHDEFWIIRTELIRSLKRFVQIYRFGHEQNTTVHSLTHLIVFKTVSPAVKLENIYNKTIALDKVFIFISNPWRQNLQMHPVVYHRRRRF